MISLKTISVLFVVVVCLYANFIKADECVLNAASSKEKDNLARLNKLKGKNFQVSDSIFTYYFSICDVPEHVTNKSSHAGLWQEEINNASKTFTIGRLTDVDIEGSKYWIRLTYKNGDKYPNSCSQADRKAVIFLFCNFDLSSDFGDFKLIEENNNRENDCGYLFELETKLICPDVTPKPDPTPCPTAAPNSATAAGSTVNSKASSAPSGLGIFGIIMLCLFVLFAIYFIVGISYMRYVRQARGWQQLPNFRFWNRIGNFQADLCDMVCRCGGNDGELRAQPYESLSGQLSDDENMLNV